MTLNMNQGSASSRWTVSSSKIIFNYEILVNGSAVMLVVWSSGSNFGLYALDSPRSGCFDRALGLVDFFSSGWNLISESCQPNVSAHQAY